MGRVGNDPTCQALQTRANPSQLSSRGAPSQIRTDVVCIPPYKDGAIGHYAIGAISTRGEARTPIDPLTMLLLRRQVRYSRI